MKRAVIIFGELLLLCSAVHAASSSPQRTFTIPSGPSAIPVEVSNQMTRQEQRLDDIDKRLAVMEKIVGEMDLNVKELVKTNTIIGFLVGMVKIFIPGIIIAGSGVWLKYYLDHRPAKPMPS
jgi:hypothetical protein